jgi:ATP-dependent Clp protease ATP-binding subunit ClpA
MFERYTEKARRVIFFARYEASAFGALQIEAEHILLGLIREDKNLVAWFFRHSQASVESIRKEIERRAITRDRISSQIDLPLSEEAKRALAFAAEESETLGHRHIGTEHLLLGLMREEKSLAADILAGFGLQLADVRQRLANEATVSRPITQKLSLDAIQPADDDERWVGELAGACVELGLLNQDELMDEFERVAALRQFGLDTEALLRSLAAKGLVDPQHLPKLAFDLRDEEKLAEFIEKLRQL